jgi:hypothetical protein
LDAVDKEDRNDSSVWRGISCKMSVEVQEASDVMIASDDKLQRIKKSG